MTSSGQNENLATEILAALAAGHRTPCVFDRAVAEETADLVGRAGAGGAPLRDFLGTVASGSPFLRHLMVRDTGRLSALLGRPPEETVERLIIRTRTAEIGDIDALGRELRLIRQEMALFLALCDLSGLWDDMRVMSVLTGFADAAVETSFRAAWNRAWQDGGGEGAVPDFSQSGVAIFGMGKYGAGELNYSSDIDLVLFHDETRFLSVVPIRRIHQKMVQHASALLQNQTAEGYVFRTDFRLRPDPSSTPVVVSLGAAEHYYEASGQTWERAAFSKSRFVAGMKKTGRQAGEILAPFVWRRNLDFATLSDIHAIKRQIHAAKGGAEIEFPGHNIKTGRGGIREVEFFVQTQQLILGGKNDALRSVQTLSGLKALTEAGHVRPEIADRLKTDYLFLRHIEHRLQMVYDAQTHEIGKTDEDIIRQAALSGYETADEFEAEVTEVLLSIHDIYADLFEGDSNEDKSHTLVFTGVEDDPDTLKTLASAGFREPAEISSTVRRWHGGKMRATRTQRARQSLTRIVPEIIRIASEAEDPDAAFRSFDRFLENLSSGVQIFSLFESHPVILERLIALTDAAPRLSKLMASRRHFVEALLEMVLEGNLSGNDQGGLSALQRRIGAADGFEEKLDELRYALNERHFSLSVQVLLSSRPVREIAEDFSGLADQAIQASLPFVREELVRQSGPVGGEVCVVALGRLGTKTLTANSDLDLVVVYDVGVGSEGDLVKWYTRFVRRLVTALSAKTGAGELYEVDMALRPSGGAGPAAVSFEAFSRYYDENAWTWEAMALTKARPVPGETALARRLEDKIAEVLERPRDEDALRRDILEMRDRLRAHKPGKSVWDVKNAPGGLTDIEFICQYQALRYGECCGRFPRPVPDSLRWQVDHKILDEAAAGILASAYDLYENILQVLRVMHASQVDPAQLSRSAQDILLARAGANSISDLQNRLREDMGAVQSVYRSIIG